MRVSRSYCRRMRNPMVLKNFKGSYAVILIIFLKLLLWPRHHPIITHLPESNGYLSFGLERKSSTTNFESNRVTRVKKYGIAMRITTTLLFSLVVVLATVLPNRIRPAASDQCEPTCAYFSSICTIAMDIIDNNAPWTPPMFVMFYANCRASCLSNTMEPAPYALPLHIL
ncbi:hypothetical protein F4819DRAFT_408137 [Hypoxylon fuscum]|nr:hypothetical protein F4819DRAFT_408137 [Hypoxylon fuscum]